MLTAMDLKERLIQNNHPATLLMWPPNLFAFTSYILGLSGAYQLAVSPPKGYHWPPDVGALETFVAAIADDALRTAAEIVLRRAQAMQSVMDLPKPESGGDRRSGPISFENAARCGTGSW